MMKRWEIFLRVFTVTRHCVVSACMCTHSLPCAAQAVLVCQMAASPPANCALSGESAAGHGGCEGANLTYHASLLECRYVRRVSYNTDCMYFKLCTFSHQLRSPSHRVLAGSAISSSLPAAPQWKLHRLVPPLMCTLYVTFRKKTRILNGTKTS